MAEISVNFIHPTDHSVMTVTIDDAMTAEEIIRELIANNFVPPHSDGGYELSIVEAMNRSIRPGQTLAEVGAKNGAKIKVISNMQAGAE